MNYRFYDEIEIVKCEKITPYLNLDIKNILYESMDYKRPKRFNNLSCIRCVEFTKNESFKNCIKFHFNHKNNYKTDTKVKYLDGCECSIDFSDISFPVNPLNDEMLKQFEISNDINLTIFGMKSDESIIILRKSENSKITHNFIFLLYVKFSNNCGRYYYVYHIQRLLAIMYKDIKHLKNYSVCKRCLSVYKNKKDLNNHVENCIT